MLHNRVITLDTSSGSGSAGGSQYVPPARYAGVFYKFSDPTQTGTIEVINRGNQLAKIVGASNSDAMMPYDQTKQPIPVDGQLLVVVESLNEASVGAKLDVTVLLDFGGDG